MKSLLPLLAAAVLATDLVAQDTLRVATFNIRYHNERDGENRWEFRRHRVAGLLRLHRVDVFGVQEALWGQIVDLHAALPDYDSFGEGRDGRAGGERSTIYWNENALERTNGATFWLSPTPDRPSRAWGASLRRICTWCEFRSRATGSVFFVFNTHFDHRSADAREQSAELLVEKIQEIAGDAPTVLMGDFNCDRWSTPYRTIVRGGTEDGQDRALALRDARSWAEHDYGPTGTWSGWDPAHVGGQIDFVFVKNGIRVRQHAVVPHGWQGRNASDHLPVLAELELFAEDPEPARNLMQGWRLAPAPQGGGERLQWHTPEFDESAPGNAPEWRPAAAGDAWERLGFADLDGEVWLRQRVFVPESWRDRDVQFTTGGIADSWTLWLNGTEVHTAGSRTQSVWDHHIALHLANSTLRFGEDNVLALRVHDVGGLGGLLGPVALTTTGGTPTASADQFERRELLPNTEFGIPEQDRQVTYEIAVPRDAPERAWLVVGIGHGYDDSGDRGVHFELRAAGDPEAEPVQRGFAGSKGFVWFEHRVTPGSRWDVTVKDADTHFGGRFAGNGCSIRADLKFESAAK